MKSVSRRDFVKTGTIATIGLGALSESALTNSDTDQIVKIGVIGMGNGGTSHVYTLLTIVGVGIVPVHRSR